MPTGHGCTIPQELALPTEVIGISLPVRIWSLGGEGKRTESSRHRYSLTNLLFGHKKSGENPNRQSRTPQVCGESLSWWIQVLLD